MTLNNISVIGIGKLGLCFALNLEKCGYNVVGVDIDPSYAASINNKTFTSPEPNVNEYLRASSNFTTTTILERALDNDILFIVLQTPSSSIGTYDQNYIDRVTDEIVSFGKPKTHKYLVISSTTTPKYCEALNSKMIPFNYEVIYNPEFIAQGSIIHDQQEPDIVLIGESNIAGGNIVKNIYQKLCVNNPPMCHMSLTEAEITKIALNCFVTTKIAYANTVGDLAIRMGCNPDVILKTIGTDTRVGSKCLKYGFGYGGPCFPRDNRAFGVVCEMNGVNPHISYATDKSNQSHLIQQLMNFSRKPYDTNKMVTIRGVSYKEGSVILEESQKLKFAIGLVDMGYSVMIEDRAEVIRELRQKYGNKFTYTII
jgi:nucleotide sugar dehydrogenase